MKVNYQWHNAPKELPDCECVCVTHYNGGYHINVWNPHYKVWDDEDGDDFQFEASKELDWMVLEVEEDKKNDARRTKENSADSTEHSRHHQTTMDAD